MRRKVSYSGKIDADVDEALVATAKSRGMSKSALVNEILRLYVNAKAENPGFSIIRPALEDIIHSEVQKGINRLARLLVRTSLEAGTARRLTVHQLQATGGFNMKSALDLNNHYWKSSVESLRSPIKDLGDLAIEMLGEEVPKNTTEESNIG